MTISSSSERVWWKEPLERTERLETTQEQRTERQQTRQENRPEAQAQRAERTAQAQGATAPPNASETPSAATPTGSQPAQGGVPENQQEAVDQAVDRANQENAKAKSAKPKKPNARSTPRRAGKPRK